MKPLIALSVAVILLCVSQAQNIGIGITTPRAKLHVFNGESGNVSPYSPLVVESNSDTYINLLSPEPYQTSIVFGKPSNSASGAIAYNAPNNGNGFQFRTNGNITRMVITNIGNVGIGTTSPNARLGFAAEMGKMITLYPSSPGDYGLGVQPGLLQIYADNFNSDVAIGYDQAGVFIERFRIRGNGALVVNGNAGNPGQVLKSNGNSIWPSWTNPTNILYSNTISLQSNAVTTINSTNPTALPGLSHSFEVTSNTKVVVNFSIYARPNSCFACFETLVVLDLNVDGFLHRRYLQDVANDSQNNISGTALINLGSGSHTISFSAHRVGPDVNVGVPGISSIAVLQIIPQ